MADTAEAPSDRKKQLRRDAKAQRAAAARATPDAGARLHDELLTAVGIPRDVAVSAYWPMGDEIDPRPILYTLHARGHPVALPVMPGKDQPLVFRAWHPDLAMADGGFGTRVPPEGEPPIIPQVLLVPLLAFDRRGYRLGYGGGFYDRTLAALRGKSTLTRAIGLAYAGQEVGTVPTDAYDQRLDMIVTERGPVALTGARG
jgi:5-formyltetrahydrofolate cyclo-ligase